MSDGMFPGPSPLEKAMLIEIKTCRVQEAVMQNTVSALRARIAELEESINGLGAKAARYENDREYNAGLVIERDARIAELEAANRWMPVGEALPEPNSRWPDYSVEVFVLSNCQHRASYVRFSNRMWVDVYDSEPIENVTHWMLLPKPPVSIPEIPDNLSEAAK